MCHPIKTAGMSDEDFKALIKKQTRERRRIKKEAAPGILRDAGIDFEELQGGSLLRVIKPKERKKGKPINIDFWPGRGRWKSTNGKYGANIASLIRFVKSKGTQPRKNRNPEKLPTHHPGDHRPPEAQKPETLDNTEV